MKYIHLSVFSYNMSSHCRRRRRSRVNFHHSYCRQSFRICSQMLIAHTVVSNEDLKLRVGLNSLRFYHLRIGLSVQERRRVVRKNRGRRWGLGRLRRWRCSRTFRHLCRRGPSWKVVLRLVVGQWRWYTLVPMDDLVDDRFVCWQFSDIRDRLQKRVRSVRKSVNTRYLSSISVH